MQLTPPCSAPSCWWLTLSVWATSPLGIVVRHLFCGLFVFFFPPSYVALWNSKTPLETRLWEGFLLFGNFSFTTPSPGCVSVPNSFAFHILSCLLLKRMGCNRLPFLVPGVLHQHSEVVLWNLLSIQMTFWWVCWGESGPRPIPLPSWDRHNLAFNLIRFTWT